MSDPHSSTGNMLPMIYVVGLRRPCFVFALDELYSGLRCEREDMTAWYGLICAFFGNASAVFDAASELCGPKIHPQRSSPFVRIWRRRGLLCVSRIRHCLCSLRVFVCGYVFSDRPRNAICLSSGQQQQAKRRSPSPPHTIPPSVTQQRRRRLHPPRNRQTHQLASEFGWGRRLRGSVLSCAECMRNVMVNDVAHFARGTLHIRAAYVPYRNTYTYSIL